VGSGEWGVGHQPFRVWRTLEKPPSLFAVNQFRGFKSPGSIIGKFCVGVKSPLQNLITLALALALALAKR
jgi:hypothetical protein